MPYDSDASIKLPREHGHWCFARAFPPSSRAYDRASTELTQVAEMLAPRLRRRPTLYADSGIAGTKIYYRFSFDVARWLAKRAPGAVRIDWSELPDTELLDDLLRHLLQPVEDEYFDSGYVTTREWVELAAAGFPGTDFDWLLAQLDERGLWPFWRQLYDAADLPLVWELDRYRHDISRNIYPVASVAIRDSGFRRRPRNVKQEIRRPLQSLNRLSSELGARMIDVAMAALATRHRETYHFNFANPDEIYLADVGAGVSIAVFGLLPAHRFPLECTMGYLILSNGVPIGYGGASILFRQVNTGINIFDEYRRSEAAYLWVQVMRVYHALAGCTRYIANPYQLGEGNDEALRSGAFWFYYHLGYRPTDPEVRQLAMRESSRLRRDNAYRSGIRTLRKLASCDMHLLLPAARQREFFDESWLATTSRLATGVLGRETAKTRDGSAESVSQRVARDLGFRSRKPPTKDQRRALRVLAPLFAAMDMGSWSNEAKSSARKILRAKGGEHELDYAQALSQDDFLLQHFRAACLRE